MSEHDRFMAQQREEGCDAWPEWPAVMSEREAVPETLREALHIGLDLANNHLADATALYSGYPKSGLGRHVVSAAEDVETIKRALASLPAAQSEREAVPETLREALYATLLPAADEWLEDVGADRSWKQGWEAARYRQRTLVDDALASLPAESPAPEVAENLEGEPPILKGMHGYVGHRPSALAASPKPPQGKMKEGDV